VFKTHFPHAVINAGSGRGQHPTQALLDAFTLRQHGAFEKGKSLAVVGDIAHSRVMRSNLMLLSRRGVDVTLVAPPTLMPEGWPGLAQGPGKLEWTTDIESVLPSVDVVMMLRMQRERMAGGLITSLDEYSKLYGLNRRRLALMRDDAVIMHPGPVNRGVEVTEDVFADGRCVINDQVTAGLALRCALLCWACGKEPGEEQSVAGAAT
jgi:aspartate carbamoyltransferase catalytic subunit